MFADGQADGGSVGCGVKASLDSLVQARLDALTISVIVLRNPLIVAVEYRPEPTGPGPPRMSAVLKVSASHTL